MIRSRMLVVVLLIGLAIFDLIPAIINLSYGSAGAPAWVGNGEVSGPPFGMSLAFVGLSVVTLFGAYGIWIGQKWGKVVTLVTRALLLLFALGDLLGALTFSAYSLALLSLLYVIASIIVVYLVLRRQPKPVMA